MDKLQIKQTYIFFVLTKTLGSQLFAAICPECVCVCLQWLLKSVSIC